MLKLDALESLAEERDLLNRDDESSPPESKAWRSAFVVLGRDRLPRTGFKSTTYIP